MRTRWIAFVLVVTRWPLVGRVGELAELERLLGPGGGPGGVALFGDAGVGKSRLVAEVVDARRANGMAVEWVRATEAARNIPLGSFAHLLAPADDAHLPDDLLHLALAGLRERSGDGSLVLAVDDAHLLDESSVALLHLAVTQSSVQVLASVRTREHRPPGPLAPGPGRPGEGRAAGAPRRCAPDPRRDRAAGPGDGRRRARPGTGGRRGHPPGNGQR